jgi:hypothetical protein
LLRPTGRRHTAWTELRYSELTLYRSLPRESAVEPPLMSRERGLMPNRSIERTYNGLRPLYAAHVKHYASRTLVFQRTREEVAKVRDL